MSRQSCINNYFKSRSFPSQPVDVKSNMSEKKVKRRSLSLIKPTTPTKSPKSSDEIKNICDVVNLCSDEEDSSENTPKVRVELSQRFNENEAASDSSQSTVAYSPLKTPQKASPTFNLPQTQSPSNQYEDVFTDSPTASDGANSQKTLFLESLVKVEDGVETPQKNDEVIQTLPETPQGLQTPKKTPKGISTPQTCQSSSSHKSPLARNKFFSPTKKRSVINRTPAKVKRSLSMEMSAQVPSRILFEEDLFADSCVGVDDKTIFLLDIIHKYLNTPSLKQLLDPESQELLMNCLQVVKPGMTLVCRLYWRKEGWYKEEQVPQLCCKKYETLDAHDLHNMIKSLVENKLICQTNFQTMTFDDFVAILKRDELKQICKDLKLKMSSKQNAIEALKNFSKKLNITTFLKGHTVSNSKRVLQMMNMKAGPCYKLSDFARKTLHKLYIIMYLGMDYNIIREKRLELVLLYDKIKKETYPISKDMKLDNASVVFKTRAEFERYMTAHNIYEDFLSRSDVSDKCAIVKQVYDIYKSLKDDNGNETSSYESLSPWLHRYTPENLYVKLLESGVQDLKRDKDGGHLLLALTILTSLIEQTAFRQHRKADWYAEKALILHNILHRTDDAAEVLLEGFKSNLSEEVKDRMRPRAKKIANQKKTSLSENLKRELLEFATKDTILENSLGAEHICKQPMDRIGKHGKVKFETKAVDGKLVHGAEEYCIYHYISSGEFTHGEHWEGRIIISIFFLLFWDIIYSPSVRGVFLSYYQLFPLDLFTDSFYSNRKQTIDDWLQVIETASEDKLLKMMQETWNNRPETEVSGFGRGISLESASAVCRCVGPRGVAALCRRLAADYRYCHSGFPDLTLWNVHTRRIKFIEVKTDSDKPSMKQIQWMQYLRQHDIETEFCYVGANTTRQRSRTGGNKQDTSTQRVKTEP